MRVLKGVAHVTDLQRVAKFSFAKKTSSYHQLIRFPNNSEQQSTAFVPRFVLDHSGFAAISN